MWLSMVFGAGSRRIWEAMCLFSSPKDAFELLTEGSAVLNLTDKENERLRSVTISQAERFIAECSEKGIGTVGYYDDLYPYQLRHLFNPPVILYYKGNISCLSGTRTITSVGTRNASEYGMRAADTICGELAAKNMVIVSGFAVGIDIASHLAAARKNRPTVCVLGCGVDVNYPKPNEQYRDIILNNGGVFISEYPPGTQPLPPNFPARNRILAGLGRAAIVFEASLKSGSLITADIALEQGREIYVLPPADIFSSRYMGNTRLLSEGAQPFYCADDILHSYLCGEAIEEEIREGLESRFEKLEAGIVWRGITAERAEVQKTAKDAGKRRKKRNNPAKEAAEKDAPEKSAEESPAEDTAYPGELTDVQQRIADELKNGKLHADELCRRLDIDSAELMTELTELEITGVIRSLPGKMFELFR